MKAGEPRLARSAPERHAPLRGGWLRASLGFGNAGVGAASAPAVPRHRGGSVPSVMCRDAAVVARAVPAALGVRVGKVHRRHVELGCVRAHMGDAALASETVRAALAGDAAPAIDRALQRGLAIGRVGALDLVFELAHRSGIEVQAVLPRVAVAAVLACLVADLKCALEGRVTVAVEHASVGEAAHG